MAYIAPLIRVFVSSTFADFHAERDALQDRVFPILRNYATSKGARFLPIDLRWGVSEAASLDQRTTRICIDEIVRCQYVSPSFNFIALLGERYGSHLLPETIPQPDLDALAASLPPPAQELIHRWYELDVNAVPPEYVLRPRRGLETTWRIDQPQIQHLLAAAADGVRVSPETRLALTASVTEREIDAGIFQVATEDHALCFFRTLSGVPETAATPFKDSQSDSIQRLLDLKRRLWDRMPRHIIEYAARWNVNQIDRHDLELFCTLVEQHLRARIDTAVDDQESRRQDEQAIGLRTFSFAKDRLAHFTGRAEPLATIHDYLAHPALEPLVVTGSSGMGKTALLLQIVVQMQQAHPNAEYVNFFIGGNTPVADLPGLLRDLYAQILAAHPETGDLQIAQEPSELEAQASAFLGLATADRPLIVFIDALDQLRGQGLSRWIPIPLPEYVHLVISLLPGPDIDALRQRVVPSHVLEVGPLSEPDGADLLRRWLAVAHRTVTSVQRAAILLAFKTYPNPLYLRLLALEASRWRSSAEPDSALPADTASMLHALLDRLEAPAEHGSLLVAHALGLIAAAKNGLGEDELLDVLSQGKDVLRQIAERHPDMPTVERCPPVLWARLFADVEPLLTEREINGARLFAFYHRQAEEAARGRYLAGEEGAQRYRELARYFDRPHQEPYLVDTPDRPFALINERMVGELAYQQHAAQLTTDLKRTLLDATFLQARIQASGTASAVEDTELMGGDATIAALAQALRVSTHVLDQAPVELVNQLHGRTAHLDAALHHVPRPLKPHFWLLSRSLPQLDARAPETGPHRGLINHCVFSQNGLRLLTASADNTVRLWDVQSRAAIQVFSGHTAMVNCCRFTPDEQCVVSGSDDGTLRLWDIASASTIRTFHGHGGRVMDCQVTPAGKQLVSASLDGTLRLWDIQTGQTLRVFRGHDDEVYSCAISPDGSFLISGSADTTLRMWELGTGRTLRIFVGHSGTIGDCVISSTGTQVVSASQDGTLRLWEVHTGRTLQVFRGHTDQVSACGLSRDDQFLLSSSQDATIRLWDIEHAREVRTLRANSEWVLACAITPDGHYAASYAYDDVLRLWNLETGEPVWTLGGQTTEVYECTPLGDGVHAFTASFDNVVRLWDLQTYTCIRTFRGHTGSLQSAQVTSNGRWMVSSSVDRTLRLWDVKTGTTLRVFRGHTGSVYRCAITPDGKHVVSTSADHTLRLWDLRTGKTVRIFAGHAAAVVACAVTRQGRHIVSASHDTTLRLWELETGRTVRTFEGHTNEVVACTLTPDEHFLLSASDDYTLRLWDLETGKTVRTLRAQGHASEMYDCAITPDGAFALSADDDGAIRLWDLRTGDEVTRWTSDAAIFCCAMHPTQPIVIAGDNRGSVHFLRLDPSPFSVRSPTDSVSRHKVHGTRWFGRLFSSGR